MAFWLLIGLIAWAYYSWKKANPGALTAYSANRTKRSSQERETVELHQPEVPVLLPDHVTPIGLKLKTADARKVYRIFLQKYGAACAVCVGPFEISMELQELSEGMRHEEDRLREEVQFAIEEGRQKVEDLQERIRDERANLAQCSRSQREDRDQFESEIALLREMLQEERKEAKEEAVSAKTALAEYRSDKRAFIVEWINIRFHGPDWKHLLVKAGA